MLATYRPGIVRHGSTNPMRDKCRCSRCRATTASDVVRSVLSGERLIELVTEEIVAKADGNPLFLEQLSAACRRSERPSIGPDGAGHDP